MNVMPENLLLPLSAPPRGSNGIIHARSPPSLSPLLAQVKQDNVVVVVCRKHHCSAVGPQASMLDSRELTAVSFVPAIGEWCSDICCSGKIAISP